MEDKDRTTLNWHLVKANRILIRLEALETRDGTHEVEHTIRDALEFYAGLLDFQINNSLAEDATPRLRAVTHRLRDKLRSLGVAI